MSIRPQEDENDVGFKPSLKVNSSQCSDVPHQIAPVINPPEEFQQQNKDQITAAATADDDKKLEENRTETSVSSAESQGEKRYLLGESEVADDDDGFATPTNSDHKIPVITQCPPAPKKIRPSAKRKASSPDRIRRNLQIDLSREVESMFHPTVQDDLGRKIKKARREEEDHSR
ncbi:hypothetical protein M9H77_03581 [Catharanthus roseus]|uniref:Uncharacterized protein n=1 Tax=Catharanthus roseus TaxID=4058 RepID=A0ACC0CC19_CATRO|nr:hypothetical protein M9H77_03581 [Catharanthus roseus]